MLFSSLTFLLYFLPAVLLIHYVLPQKLQNPFLLLASLVFYAWGDARRVPLFLGLLTADWGIGLALGRARKPLARRLLLLAGLAANFGALIVYKYAGFLLGVMCMDIYKSNILNALLIGAAASFVCGLIYYAVDILLKGYTDLPYFILHIILPETVYNCIATIPLFIITLLIYNRAESRRMKYADLE